MKSWKELKDFESECMCEAGLGEFQKKSRQFSHIVD